MLPSIYFSMSVLKRRIFFYITIILYHWKEFSIGGLILTEFIFRTFLLSKMALCNCFSFPLEEKLSLTLFFPPVTLLPLRASCRKGHSYYCLLLFLFHPMENDFDKLLNDLGVQWTIFSSYFAWLPGSTWHSAHTPLKILMALGFSDSTFSWFSLCLWTIYKGSTFSQVLNIRILLCSS